MTSPRSASIGWYRWLGLAALSAAVLSFFAAVFAEFARPGAPQNRPFLWAAVFCNVGCLLVLPLLLWSAIRVRRLTRKEWRAVLMRAVWGGPFGTLGALWDLSANRSGSQESGE